jgi:hypothetical protein
MVFDSKTYHFVDAQLDGLDFHILFGFADVVGWPGDAPTMTEEREGMIKWVKAEKKTHSMNVSRSAVVVHIRWVLRRRTLLMRANVVGI